MAIIYTYPRKTDPSSQDTLLISDTEDGNKTKQVSIHDIRGATVSGVSSIIADTPNVTLSPAAGTGDVGISVEGWTTITGTSNNIVASAGSTAIFDVNTDTNLTIIGDSTSTLTYRLLAPTGVKKGGVTALVGTSVIPTRAATGTFYPVDNIEIDPSRLAVKIPDFGSMSGFEVAADTGGPSAIANGGTVTITGGTGISTEDVGSPSNGTIKITNNSPNIPTNLTLAADGGPAQNISDGDTITIKGGTGLTSTASATDTVTIKLDNTTVTANSYTNANITVDAQGRLTAASNGSSSSSNGQLLHSNIFKGTNTSQTNPPQFAMNEAVGTTTPMTQVEFNPASTGTGTGTEVYAYCLRPQNDDDIVRVVFNFSVKRDDNDGTPDEVIFYAGLHYDNSNIAPASLEYGWMPNSYTDSDDTLLEVQNYRFAWDITVSELKKVNGDDADAGDVVYFYLKMSYMENGGSQPTIIFGQYFKANYAGTTTSSVLAGTPLTADTYLLDNAKYNVNPVIASEELDEEEEEF